MIKIVNKKVFAMFVLALLILISAAAFLVFKIMHSKRNTTVIQQGVKNSQNISKTTTNVADQSFGSSQNQTSVQAYTQYSNQQYLYAVAYPDSWYMNTESSETKQESANIEGKNINSGGQTFWSNYKNIDDYSPDQKPDDFHLLGLTIYEVSNTNSDDLAASLGFDQNTIAKKNSFDGKGISGTEYVAAGADEKNPQVMIIFQKNQRFFVFNLGFINGDSQAATIMENIAKTFSLK